MVILKKILDFQWILLKLIMKATQWKNYKKSCSINFMKNVKLMKEVNKNKDKNYLKLLSEEGHSIKKVKLCLKMQMIFKKVKRQN